MCYEIKKDVETLLGDNGVHAVLEIFAQIIQSDKNVFVDQNTRLKVYTFAPPEAVVGTLDSSLQICPLF